jgi:hypothetical protein
MVLDDSKTAVHAEIVCRCEGSLEYRMAQATPPVKAPVSHGIT